MLGTHTLHQCVNMYAATLTHAHTHAHAHTRAYLCCQELGEISGGSGVSLKAGGIKGILDGGRGDFRDRSLSQVEEGRPLEGVSSMRIQTNNKSKLMNVSTPKHYIVLSTWMKGEEAGACPVCIQFK